MDKAIEEEAEKGIESSNHQATNYFLSGFDNKQNLLITTK